MINKVYSKNLNKVKQHFEKEGSVQLQNFFDDNYFNELIDKIKKVELNKIFDSLNYSYSSAGFNDKELINGISGFLSKLLGKKVNFNFSKIFCFKHKDYTLLNDEISEEKGFKVILELTENWSDEFGGYISFVKDEEEVFRVDTIDNSFTLIKTNDKMKSFVKYINNKAGNNLRLFLELFFVE
ncbi:MAG: hypothetical protein HYS32_00660 [Candidatus Woesearchaeota archaeon]|nr:MAG: hypothetical protein HYS32_00660 [Candidatus Woesearchaeota archaeon]